MGCTLKDSFYDSGDQYGCYIGLTHEGWSIYKDDDMLRAVKRRVVLEHRFQPDDYLIPDELLKKMKEHDQAEDVALRLMENV